MVIIAVTKQLTQVRLPANALNVIIIVLHCSYLHLRRFPLLKTLRFSFEIPANQSRIYLVVLHMHLPESFVEI